MTRVLILATAVLIFALGSPVVAGATGATGATPSAVGSRLPPQEFDRVGLYGDELGLHAAVVRSMRFPVGGVVRYTDTFGACRGENCSRRHMGNDLFARKLRPLIAAQTGRVTWLRTDASGTAGNGVGITDVRGWRYLYLHVNNDTPGTDDGANPPRWRFAPGVRMGAMVEAGDVVGYLGDSGNAETTPPHCHFELRRPDGVTISPYASLRAAEGA
jgi:murein DD-endopeptidase MepM/ murein hydrolase activator NlpD